MKPYHIRTVAVTESTNADVRKAAEAGEAEGLIIQALRQTAGKGRHGRVWESPEGNLYTSVLLRPHCAVQAAAQYGFMAALAVYDVIRNELPHADISLKWPNDVLAGGKKISGILLEAAPAQNGCIDWLVIGIGLNVMNHPENALYPATSLEAMGARQLDVQAMLEFLLERLWHWLDILKSRGFPPICEVWLQRAQKGSLTVNLPHETLKGEFVRLNELGNLVLRVEDGSERTIATGDVLFDRLY